MNNSFYTIIIGVAILVIWRRYRSMHRPIKGSGARLIYPMFFMLPGLFLMFNPKVHAEGWEWLVAALLGIILSIPLIWLTDYEMREDRHIYVKKNMGFIFAFVAILAIRFFLRDYMNMLDPETKSALFMMVAFCYIIPWRVASYWKFRTVYQQRSLTQ